MTGEGSPGRVGDRARNPERHLDAELLEYALDGEDRGLGVEHVEDRLDHEHVHAAHQEPASRLGVGLGQLLERYGTGRGIGHGR